jgi:hypothetical protein
MFPGELSPLRVFSAWPARHAAWVAPRPGVVLAAPSGAFAGLRAGRLAGRQAEPRRIQFQLAVDQPEVAVAAMQGFRMYRVAEPDRLDDVFQREIDEVDLAVLRVAQLRLIGLCGVLDVIVQGRRNRDEIAFVVEPVVDHDLGEEMFAPELLQRVGPESRGGGSDKEAARVRETARASRGTD